MVVSRERLTEMLEAMLRAVRTGDECEGAISYVQAGTEGDYEVEAAYEVPRVGAASEFVHVPASQALAAA